MRETFRELASEGPVEILRNKGARVRAIPKAEAVEITEVRMVLEGLSAAKAAERVTPEQAGRLGAQVIRHKFRLARQPGRAALSLPQHELIVAAIVARDPEAMQTAMQQHLRSVAKALEATD
ncbi:FCD domain-containing protein [Nonomuraea angiospora]